MKGTHFFTGESILLKRREQHLTADNIK